MTCGIVPHKVATLSRKGLAMLSHDSVAGSVLLLELSQVIF